MKIMSKMGNKISNKMISLFVMLSMTFVGRLGFSSVNSEEFARIFREASKGKSDEIIENVSNSAYYGIMAMQRDVAMKFSQIMGVALLLFVIISILNAISQNMKSMSIEEIIKALLPEFVRNMLLVFLMVTPIKYRGSTGLSGTGMAEGTMLTRGVSRKYLICRICWD